MRAWGVPYASSVSRLLFRGSLRREDDSSEEGLHGLRVVAHGKYETLIVGLVRPSVADGRVDHQITAALLDDRLEALDGFEQTYEFFVRFVTRQVDSTSAQPVSDHSRYVTTLVAHQALAR
jgi:hypothetical protein